MSDFHGEPTQVLENQFIQLEYLVNSARIVRFAPKGKPNLFADLEQNRAQTPYGDFYFRGGHRLWHSPEAMPRTYIPDSEGALVSAIPNGVRIEMPAEAWTHIAKSIEIQLNADQPQVIVHHELRNEGAWPVEFAPWALSMLRQGGVGIFPQPTGNVDEAGLLSNRQLVLWPYTRIADPRLVLRDDFILVHATPSLPPIKFGYFNPHGWMAYWIDGILLVKRYGVERNAPYPDHGCNAESYCNDQFIELETLGPLTKLEPGQTVFHTETWEVHTELLSDLIPAEIQKIIAAL
ncbi:MAG: hypothetical protein EHM40_16405 [Chloroflexi bacterium]|nr:MAG: hypothetical protein EHM40_16405 [Chloroflexota bacterium]